MHLILHLIECLEQYGPTSAFSAERLVILVYLLLQLKVNLFKDASHLILMSGHRTSIVTVKHQAATLVNTLLCWNMSGTSLMEGDMAKKGENLLDIYKCYLSAFENTGVVIHCECYVQLSQCKHFCTRHL